MSIRLGLRTGLDRCLPIALRGFEISFHLRRISPRHKAPASPSEALWRIGLRLSLDSPRHGEFIER